MLYMKNLLTYEEENDVLGARVLRLLDPVLQVFERVSLVYRVS